MEASIDATQDLLAVGAIPASSPFSSSSLVPSTAAVILNPSMPTVERGTGTLRLQVKTLKVKRAENIIKYCPVHSLKSV